MPKGERLDDDAVRLAFRNYELGVRSVDEFAQELGCTPRALLKAFRRLRLTKRGPGRPRKVAGR